jgi:hypothetical protein
MIEAGPAIKGIASGHRDVAVIRGTVGTRIVGFLQYHAQRDDEQDETSSDAERGEIYAERLQAQSDRFQ